jgi:hypothetical protein
MVDEDMRKLMQAREPAGSIHTLILSSSDGAVGCPCFLNGRAVNVYVPTSLYKELRGHIDYEEYACVLREINSMLKRSHIPLCPCGLIPLSLICTTVYTRTVRTRELRKILLAANRRLEGKDVFWQVSATPSDMYYAGCPIAYLVRNQTETPTASCISVRAIIVDAPISTIRYDSEYMSNLFDLSPPDSVLTMTLTGVDGRTGCPSSCGLCPTSSVSIEAAQFHDLLSQDLKQLYSEADLDAFISEYNIALETTHWPIFPCILGKSIMSLLFQVNYLNLGHFVLPFAPICFWVYFQRLRQHKTEEAIARANEALEDKGLLWFCLFTKIIDSSCMTRI